MTGYFRNCRDLKYDKKKQERKNMRSVTWRKTWLVGFWIILFLLQNPLQQHLEPFQYLDEIFGLLILPLALLRFFQKKLTLSWTREKIVFGALLLIFWISGWCGVIAYRYQPFINSAQDAYVNIKFFLALGASYLMFAGEDVDFDSIKEKLWPLLNVITLALFVLCVADQCFKIFDADMRGGLRAVKLFYSAYTILVGNCVLLCGIYFWLYKEKGKKIILPLILLAFVMLSTRRVKAMGVVACVLLIYLLVFQKRQKISKKVKIFAVAVFILAGAAAAYQIVSYYFLMGVESARAVLTIGAPFIAWDHFPFGTGWGTYGSAFSVEPYSPVYGMYRMAGVWGLSPDFPDFVSDTFWPMILGECGFFGFLAILGVLFLLAKKIFSMKKDKSIFASGLVPIAYLLISSTSESAFANPIAVPLAFWLGFLFAQEKVRERKGQEAEE